MKWRLLVTLLNGLKEARTFLVSFALFKHRLSRQSIYAYFYELNIAIADTGILMALLCARHFRGK